MKPAKVELHIVNNLESTKKHSKSLPGRERRYIRLFILRVDFQTLGPVFSSDTPYSNYGRFTPYLCGPSQSLLSPTSRHPQRKSP